MINIVTAIGNQSFNNELKKYSEFNIISDDIQYFEGIFEIIECNLNIDFILINQSLDEYSDILKNINKILELNRKVSIIVVLESKNDELEKQLFKIGVFDVIYDSTDIEEVVKLLKSKNIEFLNMELRAEIDNLKKIIENKEKNKTLLVKKKNILFKECQLIAISGYKNSGKTAFSSYIARSINEKTLIIDFDFSKSSLTHLFKLYDENIDSKNIKKLIKKVNDKVDVLVNLSVLYKLDLFDFSHFVLSINELKEHYNYIIFDISDDVEFNNKILKLCDKILVLSSFNNSGMMKNSEYLKYILGISIKSNSSLGLINFSYKNCNSLLAEYRYKKESSESYDSIDFFGIKEVFFYDYSSTLKNKFNKMFYKNRWNKIFCSKC